MTLDLKLALICAQASQAAYEEDPGKRGALLEAAGLVERRYIDARRDARALLCAHASAGVILAAQGTQFTRAEIASIIENLKTEPIHVPGVAGLMMQGYWEQVQALLPDLAGVHFDIATGHSMGGTIAELLVNGTPRPMPRKLITFGAPKCASEIFWHAAIMLPDRVVRARDFAPDWPAAGYAQPDCPFAWLEDGRAIQTMSRPFWPLHDSVEDHNVDLYVADLAKLNSSAPVVALA